MPVLPIALMGANVLKRRAVEVTDFKDSLLRGLVDDMLETMDAAEGVGLAAPQVSVSKRIVIFYVPAARNEGIEIPLTIMFNPVIKPLKQTREDGWEACLSVPGLIGEVSRYTAISYRYQDITGAIIECEAEGFHARVVQHECDHLDGILYPMQMKDMSTLAFVDVLNSEVGQPSGSELQKSMSE